MSPQSKSIAEIYNLIEDLTRIKIGNQEIQSGDFYFGTSAYLPRSPLKRVAWRIWLFFQERFPGVLKFITRLTRNTPLELMLERPAKVVDGNYLAGKAIQKGARYAFVDDPNSVSDPRFIYTKSPLDTLRQITRYHRQQFKIPVIAITGSAGKTTTTQLIKEILTTRYRVHGTIGTINSSGGLMKLVLALDDSAEVGVFEIGAMMVGQIRNACQALMPTMGVITNVGKSHLGSFGGVEAVRKEKWELFGYLTANDGHCFLNLNDGWLASQAPRLVSPTTFGSSDLANQHGEVLSASPFIKIRWYPDTTSADGTRTTPIDIQTRLIGDYNLNNILAAVSIGRAFKIPAAEIAAKVEAFEPVENRSVLLERGSNLFILDAYNGTPDGFEAAISSFRRIKASKRIGILGEMVDLGSFSAEEHNKVIDFARSAGFDEVAFLGRGFFKVKDKDFGRYFLSRSALKSWFNSKSFQGATILLKGAGTNKLEKIIDVDYGR